MKDTKVFLQHIFEQSEILIDLSGKITYDEFVESSIYTNAAVRCLEIIGEMTPH